MMTHDDDDPRQSAASGSDPDASASNGAAAGTRQRGDRCQSPPPQTIAAPQPWSRLTLHAHRYPRSLRLGVMSDSHGQRRRTAEAVKRLIDGAGCTALVHLGDFEETDVLDALAALPVPVHLVLGNCDWDVEGMSTYARDLGLIVDHPLGLIEVLDRDDDPATAAATSSAVGADEHAAVRCRLVYTHGHLNARMDLALELETEYLLHGHTHLVTDRRICSTRVINPGALQRARTYTVAVIDPAADKVRWIEVPKDATRG